MEIKNIAKNKIVNFSSYAFNNLFVSPKKIEELKKLINKEKKIVIFRKVVDRNILKNITKNRNVILKGKPHFFNTFLGSKDLYIYNKLNKKSYVKGYFRKIELLKLFPKLFSGKHIYNKKVNYLQVKSFSLTPIKDEVLNIDGEIIGQTPISIETVSEAIELLN